MTIDTSFPLFTGKTSTTRAMRRAADQTQRYALAIVSARTPVDTGRLRSGWEARLAGNGLQVRNRVPYSVYVELGTKHFPGFHMLGSSIPETAQVYRQTLASEVGNAIAGRVVGTVTGLENPVASAFRSNDRKAIGALRGIGTYKQKEARGFRPQAFRDISGKRTAGRSIG